MSQPLTSNGDPWRPGDDLPPHLGDPTPRFRQRGWMVIFLRRMFSGGVDLGLPTAAKRGPFTLLLDLFSSVRLGIVLLALLFVYSSVGSAGVPVKINIFDPAAWVAPRQWRGLEMTEFEWFHWWPFKLIIGLICANIIITTLRRIPFNVINLGVWLIHTGIITLCAGSIWYFGTKVEGDAPVNRRQLVIEAPGIDRTSMSVIPGNRIIVGRGNDQYALTISLIDPQWEIRSGADEGKKAYSVNVEVRSAGGMFIRQLLADYPQYTEDVIRSTDPNAKQPMVRAIKAIGKPLVDEALKLSLEYDPQEYFYLVDSRAIFLREVNTNGTPKTDWIQRPIRGLPRYNDHLALPGDVWLASGQNEPALDPLLIEVKPAEANDPLPRTSLHVSRFLRYASIETRRHADARAPLDPAVKVRIATPQGRAETYDLVASDPQQSTASNGKLAFKWINSVEELDSLKRITEPVIHFKFPGANIEFDKPIRDITSHDPNLAFAPIEGTDYSYRVQSVQDDLNINNHVMSVAIVEIKSPQKMFTRWVFDDPRFNRDMAMTGSGTGPGDAAAQHGADIPADTNIETVYKPGHLPPAPVMLVAGPNENDLSAVISLTTAQEVHPNLKNGDVVPIAEGITLTVQQYAPHTVEETKPVVIPREQRDRDARELFSMIHVEVPVEGGALGQWLPYNLYAFRGPEEVLRRFPYRPVMMNLPDGRRIEMLFSRERRPLPAPVALDDFKVASHIGGFTGQTSTVMDWTSMISFQAGSDQRWSAPAQVSVNKPWEDRGYWYFQAQWDPPEAPRGQGDLGSRGLNYTVLGVGNRHGVNVQLAGTCIAVFGMFYAFYIKPTIKRRRLQKVYANVQAARTKPQAIDREALEVVMLEDES